MDSPTDSITSGSMVSATDERAAVQCGGFSGITSTAAIKAHSGGKRPIRASTCAVVGGVPPLNRASRYRPTWTAS